MTARRRLWVRRVVAWGMTLVVAWLASSLAVVTQLSNRMQRPFAEPPPAIGWGAITPLRLQAADGLGLGAWFVLGRPDRPTVLLLHGNGGCRGHLLGPVERVAADGCSVLMLTLRAHGDSDGDHNDIGWSARRDVAAAVGWLREQHPGRPVVVWGQSLGSAAAVFAAPDLPAEVRGYILECPYADLYTAVWNRLRLRMPLVPAAVAYAGMRAVAPVAMPEARHISPVEEARRMPAGVRVLVLAGGDDRLVTPVEAERIRDRLGDRAECVVFAGGGHLGLEMVDPDRYRAAVRGLIDRCGPPSPKR